MYDLERHKARILEFFIQVLHSYGRHDSSMRLAEHWIGILDSYVSAAHFVTFEPTVPIPRGLVPHARAVLVVTFPQTVVNCRGVSVLALYPFRIRYRHTTRCCDRGTELLRLYLETTDIKTLAFHPRVVGHDKIVDTLRETIPDLRVYGPKSYDSFFRFLRSSQ